jgi:hypothetical protein
VAVAARCPADASGVVGTRARRLGLRGSLPFAHCRQVEHLAHVVPRRGLSSSPFLASHSRGSLPSVSSSSKPRNKVMNPFRSSSRSTPATPAASSPWCGRLRRSESPGPVRSRSRSLNSTTASRIQRSCWSIGHAPFSSLAENRLSSWSASVRPGRPSGGSGQPIFDHRGLIRPLTGVRERTTSGTPCGRRDRARCLHGAAPERTTRR